MFEKSRIALDLLRADERIWWVRDQLVTTFTEGIAQSAKDRAFEGFYDMQVNEGQFTQRERTKREKYETSRAYEEKEKIRLIQHALTEVYVTIPAIQLAATNGLKEMWEDLSLIEFSPPDDEEQEEASFPHAIEMNPELADDLSRRINNFNESLDHDHTN